MNDENELLEPLATEAGQEAIVRAIRDISSLEYAVRAEQAASLASAKAGEASQSAIEASNAEDKAKDWATKTDTYVEQEIITIPPEQEGEEPTTETINLYSAKYYAALAQDIYNNMSFDSVPTENSTNMVNSGVVYSALNLKADKSTTYTKTETDNLINTRLAELVASAPAALDTLQELATALGNDPNFATTIATQLGNKADKSDTYTKTEVDTALSNVQSTLTFDNVPTANSDNPVKSSGIKTALDGKQDTLTFDSTPTANSTNPVTSGGVYTALQNVNIDIDDEITEDSDNPVTSAAIYEALLNFTPSGGGEGQAIGIAPNYSSATAILELIGNIDTTGKTYTFNKDGYVIFFIGKSGSGYSLSIEINGTLVFAKDASGLYNGISCIFKVSREDIIKVYSNGGSWLVSNCLFLLSKEALLSEQMYNNVLYENASGWSSGSITLNDALDNYDFIEVLHKLPSDPITNMNSHFFSSSQLLGTGRYMSITGFGSRYFNATVNSSISLSVASRSDDSIYKIIGYKLAKGGYSGIVSDARMTVKSGSYIHNSNLSYGQDVTVNILFDSPMPDTNYYVCLTPCSHNTAWSTAIKPLIINSSKTINGFSFMIANITNENNSTAVAPFSVDWVAIRPNSYTREGMVEDVLFSDANGVYNTTINLSGNISDYDLIIFETNRRGDNNSLNQNRSIFTASSLPNLNESNSLGKCILLTGYDADYNKLAYVNDNTLSSFETRYLVILKIIGIKFGRYVSGVAVDTTVTLNSDAVITSGAVYDALQNIPSGGGSGGSTYTAGDGIDITNAEISLETASANSIGGIKVGTGLSIDNNGVLSANGGGGNVYTLSTSSYTKSFTCDSEYENNVNTTQEKILTCSDGATTREYHKDNSVHAICGIAKISNIAKVVLVSLNPSGVSGYISRAGNGLREGTFSSQGSFYDSANDCNWYYCVYGGWEYRRITYTGFPEIGEYSSDLSAAQAILSLANYSVQSTSIQENLFNPTNYTITSGSTISDNTLMSLICGYRPIKINGETYYFVKLDNGTYYYENPNNTIEIDNQWEVTITAKSSGGSSITVDSTITQNSTNPVESAAIYTALGDKADQSTTYTKTEVDTALASKGDVTTNTDQNITGTKTFVGSKKVGFKQSTTNDKLGFTLYGNTGTERGYLEFNPTNTVDGVTGLMTIGNYATSAAGLTQVGFRRYSNISGASGAYNLLMPMVADARTPFSLTTTYQNFYLPLGFTDGTTTVKTAKSGVVDLSPLLSSLEARISALEGN